MIFEWKSLPIDTKIDIIVGLVACPLLPLILLKMGYPLWWQIIGFLLMIAWSTSSIIKKYKKIISSQEEKREDDGC